MRMLALALVALVALLQYPLWFAKGGWIQVWEVDRALQKQHGLNQTLSLRNAALDADVQDLKQGTDAIEERARSELGMIRDDEVFFQVVRGGAAAPGGR